MTKNSINEDLWNNLPSLSLKKKIEQDHKTISVCMPLFKSHARFQRRMWASQLVYEARKNPTGLVSDLTRMLVKCTRLNVTTNRQKSNQFRSNVFSFGACIFSSNLHVEQCDFWTRSRQPREKYRWTKRFGIYSIFYLKVSGESEYIEFQRW